MTRPTRPPELLCPLCGSTYRISRVRWRCDCGAALDLAPRVVSPSETTPLPDRGQGLWRFAPVWAGDPSYAVTLGEGWTPIAELDYAGVRVGVKLDHLMPTGSYKDRGASVLITAARTLGVGEVIEDSSGNAGCAVAAYAARAGMRCTIFVPSATAPSKIRQIEAYGARVEVVQGARAEAAETARGAADSVFYASHVWNPFFFEGVKTLAYEIHAQLAGRLPGTIAVPVGNGSLLFGLARGFDELVRAGVVAAPPRLVAVQSVACATLSRPPGEDRHGPRGSTIAEGIAIARPPRLAQMRALIEAIGATVLNVSDREIIAALRWAAGLGLYLEPTGAVSLAGIRALIEGGDAERFRAPDGGVLGITTGSGLKSPEKVRALLRGGAEDGLDP